MPEVVVNVLNEDGSRKTAEQVEGERASIIARGDTPIIPGSATDSGFLLKSLQDEREKRRILEAEIQSLKDALASTDLSSAEGQHLQGELSKLGSQVESLTKENTKKDVLIAHPILGEKWGEFETFCLLPENAGMNINTAAKAFLVENGLLDAKRKGLEPTTGGPRTPISTDMTVEEAKNLRENQPEKYLDMVRKGLIKF